MTIKLYHILPDNDPMGGSRNASKVSVALRELGEDFKVVDLSREKDCRPPDSPYRKINPNGVTPTLDEDGYILWESSAILRYLADSRGKLLPSDPKKRAVAQQWLSWEAATYMPALFGVFMHIMAEDTSSDSFKMASARFDGCNQILNEALKGKDYVAGEFSIADCALGNIVLTSFMLQNNIKEKYPNIDAWLHRLAKRKAWQEEPSFSRDMKAATEAGLV